jgi:GT2 family glycosyltransferase
VYPNWELCIGDDGSTAPETLDVLARHEREEPRIRVVRLPGQQGISAATNAAIALATGDFVGFLDHDDELKPHALGEIALLLDDQPDLDLIYTDEDKREPDGRLVDPFFKPDWSPDHLMSRNYVCHLLVVRRHLLDRLGGLRSDYDGSQDYDLVLRATEQTDRIAHIHEPLYTWRKVPGSTSGESGAKPWALDAARRALAAALDRRGTPGEVVDGLHPTTYRVRYAIRGRPKVSIVIPTRDRVDLLRNCIDSVLARSTYTNCEILVLDNESSTADTLAYLADLPGRVVRYPHRFNYARMMNLAAHEATGDLLLFLNNDTQVITPDWLEAMVEHAQRPEVGIVGPRLLYPNGQPQHEGTIVGHMGGHAGNVDHGGYWGLGDIVRNCSAVTGACLMVRPSVYAEIGGHDERLRIAWNDVDLCLRVRQAGYQVVYTPYAELYHVEGGTRGIHAHVDDDDFFEARWFTQRCMDPYYNANLDRRRPFQIRA